MRILHWLGRIGAMTTTGYLYSKYKHSFIGKDGCVLTTQSQPERFVIQASNGKVKLLDKKIRGVFNNNGYNIEMNKKGEIRIRKGSKCKAVVGEDLIEKMCDNNKNQRFIWIPASLLGENGRNEDPCEYKEGNSHRKDRNLGTSSFLKSLHKPPAKNRDSYIPKKSFPQEIKKKRRNIRCPPIDKYMRSYRSNKRPKNNNYDSDSSSSETGLYKGNSQYQSLLGNNSINQMDIYAQIFCLQHKEIKECRMFNRIKDEEERISNEWDMYRGAVPDGIGFRTQPQQRIRGHYAGGIDYDNGCNCKNECLKNLRNGQCYYRMDNIGNLVPMSKPCACRDGKDLCNLRNVVDKLLCELTFLNDYANFSRLLDNNIGNV